MVVLITAKKESEINISTLISNWCWFYFSLNFPSGPQHRKYTAHYRLTGEFSQNLFIWSKLFISICPASQRWRYKHHRGKTRWHHSPYCCSVRDRRGHRYLIIIHLSLKKKWLYLRYIHLLWCILWLTLWWAFSYFTYKYTLYTYTSVISLVPLISIIVFSQSCKGKYWIAILWGDVYKQLVFFVTHVVHSVTCKSSLFVISFHMSSAYL